MGARLFFISYSRSDRSYVEKLAAHLEDAAVPVWWDFQLIVGERFSTVIQSRIEACAGLIVVLSPAAVGSDWVMDELEYALDLRKVVFPLLLEECAVPMRVRRLHREDVSGGRLPGPRFVRRLKPAATGDEPRSGERAAARRPTPRDLADSGRLRRSPPVPVSRPATRSDPRQLFALTGHLAPVRSVAFSRVGGALVSGGDDGTVRVWNLRNQQPLSVPFRVPESAVTAVAVLADDRTIVSGSLDGKLRLWDVRDQRPVGQLNSEGLDSVLALAASPVGTFIAAGTEHGLVRLWDASKPGFPLIWTATRRTTVRSLSLSADGHQLAQALGSTVVVVEAETTVGVIKGHGAEVNSVAFSPTEPLLASGGADESAQIWQPAPGGWTLRHVLHVGHGVLAVAFSRDGQTLATGDESGSVQVWDPITGAALVPPLTGHEGAVYGLAFGASSDYLASAGEDGTVRVWSVRELG
ncbi:toll/interleukin-1 receptor domain-containing protein [Cryptosporangium sp. NPDC051539]|uniref:toll/interleukin-1 receptor domain-containing protein n=1 Tax=Cryptosporangium sp. NPDC051539 TaxID=3363962 RepID=UPI00379BAC47